MDNTFGIGIFTALAAIGFSIPQLRLTINQSLADLEQYRGKIPPESISIIVDLRLVDIILNISKQISGKTAKQWLVALLLINFVAYHLSMPSSEKTAILILAGVIWVLVAIIVRMIVYTVKYLKSKVEEGLKSLDS